MLGDTVDCLWVKGSGSSLDAVEVPIGPVNNVAEVLNDPHVKARELVGRFDYPGVGEFSALGLPFKFDGFDNPVVGRPPTLGEHTVAVLLRHLGKSAGDIETLRAKKAI